MGQGASGGGGASASGGSPPAGPTCAANRFAICEDFEQANDGAFPDGWGPRGDEWGEGACTIYMYGPSADHLWEAIAPVLEKRPFPKGSYARRRYGPPGTREDRVDLMWAGA
jgi:hypothetical protein